MSGVAEQQKGGGQVVRSVVIGVLCQPPADYLLDGPDDVLHLPVALLVAGGDVAVGDAHALALALE